MKNLPNPKIHNVHFYKPKPKAVYCMAMQPNTNKLALSRSDGSIELWNLTHTPFVERRISSSTENFSIEGLAWCESRLFSVGLHGLLIEYDLYKLEVKSRAVVTGEAAFCLDVNKQKSLIAIGTEQGFLNIFQITEEEVLFEKFLDKQEGRILCLKFDHSGEFVVSGGLDAVRIWSVRTNQALHRLITGRAENNKPTIVWSLAVTQDFTILSGDSRGILTVWDGKVGAQLDSYQSHRADVLSVCLSEDETSLYCAGVDPNIVNYVRITVKDYAHKWVRSTQRKNHDHDIRALAVLGNKLYSSGIDGYLACYTPPKTLLKCPPILTPCVNICSKARYLLLRYPKHLEVWSLGESGGEKDKHTGLYPVTNRPKKLLLLQKLVKVDDEDRKEGINCASISDDGGLILYSTRLGIRLLKLVCEDSPKLVPIEVGDNLGDVPCVGATFVSNDRLILAPNSGGLNIVDVANDRAVLAQTVNIQSEIEDTVMLLAVSKSDSGKFLVAGDVRGNIGVWILKNRQYVPLCKLPKYKSSPTALDIHPRCSNLVVAYSNGHIVEFDLEKRCLTNFSRQLSKNPPKQLTSRSFPIRNVCFDPRKDHLLVLHDDDSVLIIDKTNIQETDKASKTRKVSNENQNHHINIRAVKKYKHLVHLSWLSDDEMVAVEVNPLSLIEQLPPCLVQNTFGRK